MNGTYGQICIKSPPSLVFSSRGFLRQLQSVCSTLEHLQAVSKRKRDSSLNFSTHALVAITFLYSFINSLDIDMHESYQGHVSLKLSEWKHQNAASVALHKLALPWKKLRDPC